MTITTPVADVVQRAMATGRVSRLDPLSPSDDPQTSGPGPAAPPPPGDTSTDPARPALGRRLASWRRGWTPSGDPEQVAAFVGMLLLALIAAAAIPLRPSVRTVRRPTPDQLDAMADPLARVACRHLPMAALGPDMVDLTAAAKATHHYVAAGDLIIPNVTTTEGDFT